MGLSIRFYLFAEDGLQAISQRVMMGLVRGKDAMPQYAGTRQKLADVILENEAKKPARIERTQGSYLTFDENGAGRGIRRICLVDPALAARDALDLLGENGLDEVGEGRLRPDRLPFPALQPLTNSTQQRGRFESFGVGSFRR
ncbi:hypothetical protein [Bradyrhizobium diversitatis]|uniref:Uncharacterized protein n=1 Tax=Bradyrhizobium diversitatis TaxID=2755406 RepID=A0ABS0PGB0_9BRAD|nr:hypothetical protein [Bradyrhizobium diversitatis]